MYSEDPGKDRSVEATPVHPLSTCFPHWSNKAVRMLLMCFMASLCSHLAEIGVKPTGLKACLIILQLDFFFFKSPSNLYVSVKSVGN